MRQISRTIFGQRKLAGLFNRFDRALVFQSADPFKLILGHNATIAYLHLPGVLQSYSPFYFNMSRHHGDLLAVQPGVMSMLI